MEGLEEEENESRAAGRLAEQRDTVQQQTAGRNLVTVPGIAFPGLGSGFIGPQGQFQFAFAPPDPTASAGLSQVVETVNLSLAVFDKATGAVLAGPISLPGLFAGFNDQCANAAAVADPLVVYDKQANRWVIQFVTLPTPYLSCFAVSTSPDATGTYNLYAFQVAASGYNATPRLGVWTDGYYLSARIFTSKEQSTYVGPAACAVDKKQMINGQAATMQCFQINNTTIDGMLPADLDGRNAPPAGAPEYFLVQGTQGSYALYLYRFHVDFSNAANSTFRGPIMIKVARYTPAGAFTVPQPGTTQLLATNGVTLMHRLAYRNFPHASPPHESLLALHSVTVGQGSNKRVGQRWYELWNPGTAVSLFQQGTYSPDLTSRWMGSMAMDKAGNIALAYSAASSSVFPSIRYTGRTPTDPTGIMETEVTILNGSASQTGTSRWGDFTSMSVDPADDCTMWYAGEYMASTGALNWGTYLYSFKFPSCQ